MKKFLKTLAAIAVMAIFAFQTVQSYALSPFMTYMDVQRSSYNLEQIKEIFRTGQLGTVPLKINYSQFKIEICQAYNNQKNSRSYGRNYDDLTPETFYLLEDYLRLRPAQGKMKVHGLNADGTIGSLTRDPYPSEMIVYVSPNEMAEDLDQMYPDIDLCSAACLNTVDVPVPSQPPAPRDEGGGTTTIENTPEKVNVDVTVEEAENASDQYVENNYYTTDAAPSCGYSAPISSCYDPYYGSSGFGFGVSASIGFGAGYSTGYGSYPTTAWGQSYSGNGCCGGSQGYSQAPPVTNIYNNNYSINDSYNDQGVHDSYNYRDDSYYNNVQTTNNNQQNNNWNYQVWNTTQTNTTTTTTTTTTPPPVIVWPGGGGTGWNGGPQNPPPGGGWTNSSPQNPPPGDGGWVTGGNSGGTGNGTGGGTTITGTGDPFDPGDGNGVIWGGKMVNPHTSSTLTNTASLSRKASAIPGEHPVPALSKIDRGVSKQIRSGSIQNLSESNVRSASTNRSESLVRSGSAENGAFAASNNRGIRKESRSNELSRVSRPENSRNESTRSGSLNSNASANADGMRRDTRSASADLVAMNSTRSLERTGQADGLSRVQSSDQDHQPDHRKNRVDSRDPQPQNMQSRDMGSLQKKQDTKPAYGERAQNLKLNQQPVQRETRPSYSESASRTEANHVAAPRPVEQAQKNYPSQPSANRNMSPSVNRNAGPVNRSAAPANRNTGGGGRRSR